jgi:hypothetical protein
MTVALGQLAPQSSDAPFDLEELTVGELSGKERFATRCPRSKPRIAPQDLSHGQPSTIDHKAVKTLESGSDLLEVSPSSWSRPYFWNDRLLNFKSGLDQTRYS